MNHTLEIKDCDIVVRDGKTERKIGISAVLAEYGTRVMLELDAGKTVRVSSEPKDYFHDDRVGG